MAVKHIKIYKKYIQARDKFNSYTMSFLNNTSTSSNSKRKIRLYNTIAAWLDFIGQEVPNPIFRDGVAPSPVTFRIEPIALSGLSNPTPPVHIFLQSASGLRTLLGTAIYPEQGGALNLSGLTGLINTHPDISATYNSENSEITISFGIGSKYNNGKIIISNTASLEASLNSNDSSLRIRGGADSIVTTINLSDSELDNIDKLLDRVAIELDTIYSDKKYEELSMLRRQIKELTVLKTTNNLTLTAENGSPLEV